MISGIKRPRAYKEYLNESNIILINNVYMKDFELFNYDMLHLLKFQLWILQY
jgi:hypothetical protein